MKATTLRSWIVTGALAAGAAVGAAAVANAAGGGSSSGTGQGSAPSLVANGAPPAQPPPFGRDSRGPGETLLTGSAASKAKAAALAAVPGATVLRLETDSGPAAYEAHMRKVDGTPVTAKLDSSFHVTAVQSGMGAGPGGPPPGSARSGPAA